LGLSKAWNFSIYLFVMGQSKIPITKKKKKKELFPQNMYLINSDSYCV
jgi:hypothetical protein